MMVLEYHWGPWYVALTTFPPQAACSFPSKVNLKSQLYVS